MRYSILLLMLWPITVDANDVKAVWAWSNAASKPVAVLQTVAESKQLIADVKEIVKYKVVPKYNVCNCEPCDCTKCECKDCKCKVCPGKVFRVQGAYGPLWVKRTELGWGISTKWMCSDDLIRWYEYITPTRSIPVVSPGYFGPTQVFSNCPT